MEHISLILLTVTLSLAILAYRRVTGPYDVSSLRGPDSRSWIYGNMIEFILGIPAGKAELRWFAKYGDIFKFRACFGEERLMISDAAAIRYMMQNPHLFAKSSKHQLINLLGFGKSSLTYIAGDNHRRIRGVMSPIFSAKNVRALTATLEKHALNLCDEWAPISGNTINAYREMHKATLYAITEAVMGYDSAGDQKYTSAYTDLLVSVSQRSNKGILVDALVSLLPLSASGILEKYPPSDLKLLLDYRFISGKISETLLNKRVAALKNGEALEDDLLSILARGNEKAKNRMTEEEINSQLGMLVVAGEDTTANSLVWILYVLASNKEWQATLRQELEKAQAAKSNEVSVDYDQLPFLNALIKETLRFYPTGPFTERIASADAVVPLSTPIATKSGKTLTEVRIKRGQAAVLSITGYNRLKSVWGEDADELNPYRWLDGREVAKNVSIGPYANLFTFIGGPRACLGWRFAILELQVVVAHIVRQFALSMPENVRIQPANAITLVPMDADEKMHLPLKIERL